MIIRIYHECEDRIIKSVKRITVWHHKACRVMTNGDLEGQIFLSHHHRNNLGPSINGLVTDGNTKLCCRGFLLALFQSTTANKIESEHTRDYMRLLQVCKAEIIRVTVKRIEVF